MSEIPRRSIDEIYSRYEMEPELKDFYVEGAFDRELLSQISFEGAIFYEIDTVDVPLETLEKFGLSSGNKQRIIALARELSSIEGELGYRCIVDRDMDHWLNEMHDIPRLKWTDYCSIELYFFSKEIVSQVLFVLGRGRAVNDDAYLGSLTNCLVSIFSLRLADRSLGLSLKPLGFEKHLKIKGGLVFFDSDEYVKRWLGKSNELSKLALFKEAVADWRQQLNVDPRVCIRGHDFIDVLAWSIKALKGLDEMASSVAVERLLLALADKAPDLRNLIEQ